jgi:hypothetical protein
MYTLIDVASFSPESLQPPSAWVGHIPFAAWVIRQVVPGIFVELGTHTGNSYFSFCQSVAEAGLPTKCYAVDTWRGDDQAGLYDEKVFAEVNSYNERRYDAFSRLLRMTFDEALDQFPDESVDLLHIDGLHTYDAVRHDFEVWLPKLAPGAIVMFHDTGVRERSFGVWQLWEELQSRYPNNIEFSHSHGLGILQLNNAPEGKTQKWLQLESSEEERFKTYFAALGTRQMLGYAVAERDVQITDLRQHAANLDAVIIDLRQHSSNLEQVLATRDAHIADLRQHATNLDAVISELRQQASNLE